MYVDYLLHLTGRDLERRYFTTNGDNDVKLTDSSTSVANKGITVGPRNKAIAMPLTNTALAATNQTDCIRALSLIPSDKATEASREDSLSRWEETNP